uniref:Saposin B-type domain-containing protein n=1 Tax=Caenorhabditis tropicalis TaxID=1561998 RepID=A0A1I7TAW7_9PELO
MIQFFIFLVTVNLVVSQITTSGNPPTGPNILCELCNSGFSLVQSQLVVLESITQNNLGSFIDKVCQAAPTDVPIVKALCDVLRDDLVKALITLIQGFKDQTNPRLICGYLSVCDSKTVF